jgi:hypothetical protein
MIVSALLSCTIGIGSEHQSSTFLNQIERSSVVDYTPKKGSRVCVLTET